MVIFKNSNFVSFYQLSKLPSSETLGIMFILLPGAMVGALPICIAMPPMCIASFVGAATFFGKNFAISAAQKTKKVCFHISTA